MKTKYLIVALFSIFASPCQMAEGYSIKLVGSNLKYAGRVQIRKSGSTWKSICDAGWDINDARVVCRELGYFEAEAGIIGEAFGHGEVGQVIAKEFHCRGNEKSLTRCVTHNSTERRCSYNRVAAVLCKPNDFVNSMIAIMVSMVGCLALTSIIILIVTCKTMRIKKRFPATNSETAVSNPSNKEEEFTTEGERRSNESTNAISSENFSYVDEERTPHRVETVGSDDEKSKEASVAAPESNPNSNPEVIVSITAEAQNSDNHEQAKHKESKKGRYMPLLRGSRKILHSVYEKLLKRNSHIVNYSSTDVDYADDYYASFEYRENWLGQENNITDIDSSSNEGYNEIDSKKDKENVDNDVLEYTPMLSFTHMHSQQVKSKDEGSQDEYLAILAPKGISEEISPDSTKRDSDYLDPVETGLPAFPEISSDVASSSYDMDLPQPPSDLLTSTNVDQDDGKNGSRPANKLGSSNQGCSCEEDLMCKNCLDVHSAAKHTTLDLTEISKIKLKGTKEEESDEDFEYMPMDLCNTGKNSTEVGEKVQRNSANYTIPATKLTKEKRDQGSFPEELNKKRLKNVNEPLSSSSEKRLVPNKKDLNGSTVKNEGKYQARNEKGCKMSPIVSPRSARKVTENEKLSKEKNGHLEESTPKLTPKTSFTKTKELFENNVTAPQNQTKKMADFSKRLFKSEETESNIQMNGAAGKARSESLPVESTNRCKPSASFLADLTNVLKANGSKEDGISGQKQEDFDLEHDYELDYEDISSPTESKYENDDFYAGSHMRSGSRPESDEYDYVHEKERNSLHFYEAVVRHSGDFEEDQYEKI